MFSRRSASLKGLFQADSSILKDCAQGGLKIPWLNECFPWTMIIVSQACRETATSPASQDACEPPGSLKVRWGGELSVGGGRGERRGGLCFCGV